MRSDHHGPSVNRLAFSATVHCLTGCSIGEVLGMVIGTTMHWRDVPTIALSIVLAFFFGYALAMRPLVASGLSLANATRLALAADSLSIAVMEVVDNAILLLVPGAMDAHVSELLFWASLLFSLLVAGVAAFPVNRWLILRGRGHAVVHGRHHKH